MNTLACIKRVPETGARIVLTDDKRSIDTSNIGFTISPHEECAIEGAVRLAEETDGTATTLTLGPPDADEQLRTGIAMDADEALHLETDGGEWGPRATATAIAEGIESTAASFELLFFGSESADQGNHQVGVRVAHELGLPVVTGVSDVEMDGDTVIAEREVSGGSEVYELPTPAVLTVREGLNSPRYPSMRSKMRARQAEIAASTAERPDTNEVRMTELETPDHDDTPAEILGESADAAEDVVAVLGELEVV